MYLFGRFCICVVVVVRASTSNICVCVHNDKRDLLVEHIKLKK